jgi:Xaa-Pro aminopeptidase 2
MEIQYPGDYLTFELVSFVPYDRNLIDVRLLSPEQVSVLSTAYSLAYEELTSNHPRPFLPLFPLL